MIHYSLRCEPAGHGFDGWFRSGTDFEAQAARGLLECPICGSADVAKALMRPAVSTSERAVAPLREGTAMVGAPPEMAEMVSRLQEMAREVRAKADYVGAGFADEARRIHYGEVEERQIYGEASNRDVHALLEEGIAAIPLPPLPEDKN
ncbi:DUF1178 family protein [Aureimonas sp. AU40]|uniref:DUF1178 family protein n=1 Tax=Aureimonas sp. AU40 TaxID=1637747 RepID=UPI0007863D4F|nr:DUF1178 family protein [Aureimonas sp. AU40]